MSEFTVRKTRHGKWGVYMPNGAILTSFITERKAINHANYLNEGNTPLLEEIAVLKVALEAYRSTTDKILDSALTANVENYPAFSLASNILVIVKELSHSLHTENEADS